VQKNGSGSLVPFKMSYSRKPHLSNFVRNSDFLNIFSARCVHYNESSRYCHDVRPPVVCLSVHLRLACIVIIRRILARI